MEMEIDKVSITRIGGKYNIEAVSGDVKKNFNGVDKLDVEGPAKFDSSFEHDTLIACEGVLNITEVENKKVGKIICK